MRNSRAEGDIFTKLCMADFILLVFNGVLEVNIGSRNRLLRVPARNRLHTEKSLRQF